MPPSQNAQRPLSQLREELGGTRWPCSTQPSQTCVEPGLCQQLQPRLAHTTRPPGEEGGGAAANGDAGWRERLVNIGWRDLELRGNA